MTNSHWFDHWNSLCHGGEQQVIDLNICHWGRIITSTYWHGIVHNHSTISFPAWMAVESLRQKEKEKTWLECRLGVPVHCLQSNGVIIHMTSCTLHNAATSWITLLTIRLFQRGSRGGALVGSQGDEVPQLKVDTRKLYAFLVVDHTLNIWSWNTDYWKRKLRSTSAQLQSANSAPIRTTFNQRMKNE